VGLSHNFTQSPRRHPLEAIQERLTRQGLPDSRTVTSMKNREKVRCARLFICCQRPETAGGVVFVTLEDETRFVMLSYGKVSSSTTPFWQKRNGESLGRYRKSSSLKIMSFTWSRKNYGLVHLVGTSIKRNALSKENFLASPTGFEPVLPA
jgi:hypothetical protein